jgi:hypothetical protein
MAAARLLRLERIFVCNQLLSLFNLKFQKVYRSSLSDAERNLEGLGKIILNPCLAGPNQCSISGSAIDNVRM